MKPFADWAMLLIGGTMALLPIVLFAAFVEFMQRFGGVPWSWDLLSINVHVIAVLIAIFACGISLATFAAWRLRAHRNRRIPN